MNVFCSLFTMVVKYYDVRKTRPEAFERCFGVYLAEGATERPRRCLSDWTVFLESKRNKEILRLQRRSSRVGVASLPLKIRSKEKA